MLKTVVQSKEDIQKILDAHTAELDALGVARIQLFGSYLRGEQTPKSDIDLLVDFAAAVDEKNNQVNLKESLEAWLGQKVDIVPADSLKAAIRPNVLREIESGGTVKMGKSALPYLQDILEEANYLIESSADVDYAKFLSDRHLKRSFTRSLEIIGEAVKNLSKDFRHKYPQIVWKKIAANRDVMIHSYRDVRYDTVWETVTVDVPILKQQVEEILAELQGSEPGKEE